MITFICKKVLRVAITNKELFIEGREYKAVQNDDEFNFIDYQSEAIEQIGLYITLSRDEVKKYFKRKEITFGR
jgi:hypothetical protein